MVIIEIDVWIIDNGWIGLMFGEFMFIIGDRECLIVFRGKWKKFDYYLY